MKRIYPSILLTAALLLTTVVEIKAQSFDFEADGRHYTLTSPTTVTLEQIDHVGEELTVNATVDYEGHQLTVTAVGGSLIPYTNRSIIRRVILPETIETIGYRTFVTCESLRQINLPKGLRVIGSEAFNGCKQLQIDAWPDSLRTIGDDAFAGCSSLGEVALPERLESIGRCAFNYSGVTAVCLASRRVKLGDGVFRHCDRLKSVIVEGDVLVAVPEEMCWNCQSLESVVFKGSLIQTDSYIACFVGTRAFQSCPALTTLQLPQGVTSIGRNAFEGCSSLESIQLDRLITYIAPEAFLGSGLRQIELPEMLTTLGGACFYDCRQLESLTLPLRIEHLIGIIDGASAVKRLEVKQRVPQNINPWDFYEVYDKVTLVVPAGSRELYAQHEAWGQFKQIEEAEPEVYTFYADISVHGHGRLFWNGRECAGGEHFAVAEGETVSIRQEPLNERDSVIWLNFTDDNYTNVQLHRDSVYTFVVDNDVKLYASFQSMIDSPELVEVVIRQADLGAVVLGIEKGRSLEFTVAPEEGWQVNSITLNGEDITDRLADYQILTTGPLEGNAEIRIAFEQKGADGIGSVGADCRLRVHAVGNVLYIDNAEPGDICVYSLDGKLLRQLQASGPSVSVSMPANNVYTIKNGKKTIKIGL